MPTTAAVWRVGGADLPHGEAALAVGPQFATHALTRTFPAYAQHTASAIPPQRIQRATLAELLAQALTDKAVATIRLFRGVLAAGLPRLSAERLCHGLTDQDLYYVNAFVPQPVLYLRDTVYDGLFAADIVQRRRALTLYVNALIAADLALAPQTRLLPHDPWLRIAHAELFDHLLPALRAQTAQSPQYDAAQFAALVNSMAAAFPPEQLECRAADTTTKHLINAAVNSITGTHEQDDDVVWERERAEGVRLVAKGALVCVLFPEQQLPTFEFSVGSAFDMGTRAILVEKASAVWYELLQTNYRVHVTTHAVSADQTRVQPVYNALGLQVQQLAQHYFDSTMPREYYVKAHEQRMQKRFLFFGVAPTNYPSYTGQ